MATTPVIVSLPAGRSGDKLELYPVEGTAIANGAGGDLLTALFSGSRLYKADVTEAITGDHQAVIKTSGGNVIAGGYVLGLTDTTDRQYVGDESPTLPAEIASSVAAQSDIAALIAAWADGGRLDLIVDAILGDTAELQADLTNGGRLDLLVDAIKAKADLITASTVTITSPVASDGTTVTVVQGDSYNNTDSRAITWTGDTADQWPDLTGATLEFTAVMKGAADITAVPTVVTATGTQVFRMELSSTDTDVPTGRYRYDVQATLSSERVITLVNGAFVVTRTYTDAP